MRSQTFLCGSPADGHLCPIACAQHYEQGDDTKHRVVALSVRGDGLTAGRLDSFVVESVRVSDCVLYTCSASEVAESLKAAVC